MKRIASLNYVGQYGLCRLAVLQVSMESKDQRRLRRLKQITEEKGGVKAVAQAAGIGWQSLDQILKGTPLPEKQDGTRSQRALGDPAAEAIEDAYKLGRGWFDWPLDFVDHRAYWALLPEQRAIAEDAMRREIDRLSKGAARSSVANTKLKPATKPRIVRKQRVTESR